jgi:outer membrane protein TolC
VGVIPQLAVLQSETGVAFREEELIVARNEVANARDRLIRVVNLFPGEVIWAVAIVPQDEPLVFPPSDYVEDDQISMALQNRPELKQIIKQQEAAELGSRYAKNQLLPSFDITGSMGLVGLDGDYDSSFIPIVMGGFPPPPPPHKGLHHATDDLFSGDNFQWMIGFKFEIPWGSRSERGQYRAANLQVGQADAGLRSLRQVIILDVRNALRRMETSWQRLVSTRETTRFREKSLVAEKKKYDVGVSTAHDLLRFEEELAQAKANEERAKIDYALSLSNLSRANATLLRVRNIEYDTGS